MARSVLLSNFIHFYRKDTVSSLNYFRGSKRNWDLCPGEVCLNFTEINDFHKSTRLGGYSFRGYETGEQTTITKDLNLIRRDKGRE